MYGQCILHVSPRKARILTGPEAQLTHRIHFTSHQSHIRNLVSNQSHQPIPWCATCSDQILGAHRGVTLQRNNLYLIKTVGAFFDGEWFGDSAKVACILPTLEGLYARYLK